MEFLALIGFAVLVLVGVYVYFRVKRPQKLNAMIDKVSEKLK